MPFVPHAPLWLAVSPPPSASRQALSAVFAAWWMLALCLAASTGLAASEPLQPDGGEGGIVRFGGRIDPNATLYYDLKALKKGGTLIISARTVSGNLDPFLAVLPAWCAPEEAEACLTGERTEGPAADRPLAEAATESFRGLALAYDDDSGTGHAARLTFTPPADGDYVLLLSGSPLRDTSGTFELSVTARDGQLPRIEARSQDQHLSHAAGETVATITDVSSTKVIALDRVRAGDTIYVLVDRVHGNGTGNGTGNEIGSGILPSVTLYDYADKPLARTGFTRTGRYEFLAYLATEDSEDYRLKLGLPPGASAATGRILAGLNMPSVLAGVADPRARPFFKEPITVRAGIRIQQITGVDQRSENFGVVAALFLKWKDPDFAFNPDECGCTFKALADDEFQQYVLRNGLRWPLFTVFNQQGNRWVQNRAGVIFSTGEVFYLERFSVQLQAPDFDFRKFPFDTQTFFLRVDGLWPEEFYRFEDLPGYSFVGGQLGEEEWVVTGFDTSISSAAATTFRATSRFTLRMEAVRHLNYYIVRIFVPLLLIIAVSWATFFLRDYGKRVDVAGANLLLLIAFNFTISSDLPRLGYLTYLDTILVGSFIVTSMVMIFNVYLKRLDQTRERRLVQRLDPLMLWLYPLLYLSAFATVTVYFLK